MNKILSQTLMFISNVFALGIISFSVKAHTNIYRLSNSTGAHLYTSYMTLDGNGWTGEGVKFETSSTGTPIYRVYNPASGEHLYTKDLNQIRVLTTQQGWKTDGSNTIAWYASGNTVITPIDYRAVVYNYQSL